MEDDFFRRTLKEYSNQEGYEIHYSNKTETTKEPYGYYVDSVYYGRSYNGIMIPFESERAYIDWFNESKM